MNNGKYIAPILTVDPVVFRLHNNQLEVLLIKRATDPFKGEWALPGGYCASGEKTHQAVQRVLLNKTGLSESDLQLTEQLYTFDTKARDPRGLAVTVAYLCLGRNPQPKITTHTQNPQFFPLNNLPETVYNHKEIIDYAHKRLASKITYTNAVYALLPSHFTLSQLQKAYEAILMRELDKRNFRKKFLSLDLVNKTGKYHREGAHRPALLYTFKQESLQALTRSFD